MKTRENELHEPRIEMLRLPEFNSGYYLVGVTFEAIAYCPLCGFVFTSIRDKSECVARKKIVDRIWNYCPMCGVRVKEVDE